MLETGLVRLWNLLIGLAANKFVCGRPRRATRGRPESGCSLDPQAICMSVTKASRLTFATTTCPFRTGARRLGQHQEQSHPRRPRVGAKLAPAAFLLMFADLLLQRPRSGRRRALGLSCDPIANIQTLIRIRSDGRGIMARIAGGGRLPPRTLLLGSPTVAYRTSRWSQIMSRLRGFRQGEARGLWASSRKSAGEFPLPI